VGIQSNAAEPARHYALFGISFEPSDKYSLRRMHLAELFNALTSNSELAVSDTQFNAEMGNPIELVSDFLSDVHQKIAKMAPIESGKMRGRLPPMEITIYLNAHGSNGRLHFYDSKSDKKGSELYEDLWRVIDQSIVQLESEYRVAPIVNIIIESCHSGTLGPSLQVHKWIAKKSRFNVFASADSHEVSYGTSTHTLLDLALAVDNSVNNCTSCKGSSRLEGALQIASQIPLIFSSLKAIQTPQLYRVIKGKTRYFRYEASSYLKLIIELFKLESVIPSRLKLMESGFSLSAISLFKEFKGRLPLGHPARVVFEPEVEYPRVQLPVNAVELDTTSKMWDHWEPILKNKWPEAQFMEYARVLSWFVVQPETEARARVIASELAHHSNAASTWEASMDKAVEITYETLHLLNAGRTVEAIQNIPKFNEVLSQWPQRDEFSRLIQRMETGFINSWVKAINSGVVRFMAPESEALTKLTLQNQFWFEEQMGERSSSVENKSSTLNFLGGFSSHFSKPIKIEKNDYIVSRRLLTKHWYHWRQNLVKRELEIQQRPRRCELLFAR
jgi:hypothetical protein